MEVFLSLHLSLEGLRRIGWPHTASHDAKFPIEIAVEQAARLLLQGERDDGRAVERMKEGLARTPADVAWFRTFAAERPTLPRPHDARLTTAIGGIPLLGDAEIERVVEVIAARTEACLAGRGKDDLLADWWKQLGRHGEHLPAGCRAAHRAGRHPLCVGPVARAAARAAACR